MLLSPLLLPLAFAPPEGQDLEAAAQAIFDESCTLCHDASDDNLNLEDASVLVGKPGSTGMPLIDPGNPKGSYLYLKMVGAKDIEGEPMPLGDEPLPAEQLTTVRDWIASLPPAKQEGGGEGSEGGEGAEGGEGSGGAGEATGPEEPPLPKRKSRQPFFGTQQINLQTTTTLGKKTISFRIHHRLGLVGKPGDRNYLGLAGGAVISIGAEYGIIDGLDVLARWTNSRLDWELGLKYVPVRQEDDMPLSFGMYASFEALTDFPSNSVNPLTGNFQVMLSRLWFQRWSTQLTVNYSLLTNHSPTVIADLGDGNGPQRVTDNRGTLDVGLATTVWVDKKKKNGIDIEYLFPIPADVFYYRGGNVDPQGTKIGSWGLGWSTRVGLHVFQVFVTNTRNIHTNLVVPGGDTKNPFSPFGDFFFGFNITRKWKL
jgi:mono/diheme cytochrome c family protein